METCKRPDISERIILGLAPTEFPKEFGEIQEHLADCPACKDELDTLKKLDLFLRANKGLLAEALCPCPSVDALMAVATGEDSNPDDELHVSLCPSCAEQVQLLRELSQEKIEQSDGIPSPGAKSLILSTVNREYGMAEEPQPGTLQKLLELFTNWLHVPSLAMGVAAAALLVFVLIPEQPKESAVTPALSAVTWEKPPVVDKGPLAPKGEIFERKRVALILLFATRNQGSPVAADQLYSELDIVKRLGQVYDFLSPKEIKEALSASHVSGSTVTVADLVFEKTPADYVLTFEILHSHAFNAVKGTLFERGQKIDRGSISQTGVAVPRIPSKITLIGTQLLLDAEHS
jgi:hypothetical protein